MCLPPSRAANPAGALALLVSGILVWLLAPVVVAFWAWQLQGRSRGLAVIALAWSLPPIVALVVSIGILYGLGADEARRAPPPLCGTPLVGFFIIGAAWVLLVAVVNAGVLLRRYSSRTTCRVAERPPEIIR